MMKRAVLVLLLTLVLAVGIPRKAAAHASLLRSDPLPNSVLVESPSQIRLWFTEPVEFGFSYVTLYDAAGQFIPTGDLQFSETTRQNMTLPLLAALPDGLYTVVWQTVSSTDGHGTSGQFAFAVGTEVTFSPLTTETTFQPPWGSWLIRALNLFSLAGLMGGLGFMVWVYEPALALRRVEPWLWGAWGGVGLSALGLLAMQADTNQTYSTGRIVEMLTETRFGLLWLLRVGLWWALGALLGRGAFRWGLAVSVGLVIAQSLFSHASGVHPETLPAILIHGWHVGAMALWLGGLAFLGLGAFIARGDIALLSRLVARFSNYARVTLAAVLLTGVYLTWLHVGSWAALTQTSYGQALGVKLLLIFPLLVLAGINGLITGQRLARGETLWAGRFLRLLALEGFLMSLLVVAAGLMTAINPARNDYAVQQAQPETPQAIRQTQTVGAISAELFISSDVIGANDFQVTLKNADGSPVEGAGIQANFEHQTEDLQVSGLMLQPQGEGVYGAKGANLNTIGEWVVRLGLPNQEALLFPITMKTPPPDEPPTPDFSLPPDQQQAILLYIGLLLAGSGAVWALPKTAVASARLTAGSILVVGVLLAGRGLWLTSQADSSAVADVVESPTYPLAQVINSRIHPLPLLITSDGRLLEPKTDEAGLWVDMAVPSHVKDAYVDSSERLWVGSEAGLYRWEGEEWLPINDIPAYKLRESHGFFYALGEGVFTRIPQGEFEGDPNSQLVLANPDARATGDNLLMLGNHTHALLNGAEVYITDDLGLSWETADSPEPITLLTLDPTDNLLGVSAGGVYAWGWDEQEWVLKLPLPDGHLIEDTQIFNQRVYAVAGGRLYRQGGTEWQDVTPPEADGAYFGSLALRYPDRLWLLDVATPRLWFSGNAQTWESVPIRE